MSATGGGRAGGSEASGGRRVALVTGSARGIGAAAATRLAADGFDVAVLDLRSDAGADTVAAVEAAGGRGVAVEADVSDEAAVTRAVDEVAERLGPPTVLVNNAGIVRNKPFHRLELADWKVILQVHLDGAFLMARAVRPHMVAASWGRIVNVSSVAATGWVGQANYSAAKAGLLGFTKTLALELGRHNVTVNAVAPGFVVTDMTREIVAGTGASFDEAAADMGRSVPVGRPGTPDDIANAIAFFADERSGYVSGQVLYVAGGPVG